MFPFRRAKIPSSYDENMLRRSLGPRNQYIRASLKNYERHIATNVTRRHSVLTPLLIGSAGAAQRADAAQSALSKGWQAVTGAQADLFYPSDPFEGVWIVNSFSSGAEQVASSNALSARDVDEIEQANARANSDVPLVYKQRFIRCNEVNKCIADRAFNLAELEAAVEGVDDPRSILTTISWDANDPNVLREDRGDTHVFLRVTRRRQSSYPSERRLETSELFETVIEQPGDIQPSLKRTRVSTKWKYRSRASVEDSRKQPLIVANQIVGSYPQSGIADEPLTLFRYKLAMYPAAE